MGPSRVATGPGLMFTASRLLRLFSAACSRPMSAFLACLGSTPNFRGFDGEEGSIHGNSRRRDGERCACRDSVDAALRPADGVAFSLRVADEFRDYLLRHAELGLDHQCAAEQFGRYLQAEEVGTVFRDMLGQRSETTMERAGLR